MTESASFNLDPVKVLCDVYDALGMIHVEDWDPQAIRLVLDTVAMCNMWTSHNVHMIVRIAITGTDAGPPLFEFIDALGVEETQARIQRLATGEYNRARTASSREAVTENGGD